MTTARKLLLLALTALAAMAFAATNASAQVEVINEQNPGVECDEALANCEVVIEGESHITALPSGVIVSECSDDFHIEWNHDGTGHVHWTGINESAIGCNTANCEEMSDEWPVHSTTEIAPDTVQVHIEFCLRTLGTHNELECEGRVNAAETTMLHRYEVSGTILCAGGARRVEVHGFTHGEVVEFVH